MDKTKLIGEIRHFLLKTILLVLVFLVVVGITASTWLAYRSEKYFDYGPILSWTEDPRTTMTITWGSYVDRNWYVIYWNESFKGEVRVSGKLLNVTLRGLTPGSTYNYVIGYYENGNSYNWSKVYTFRTAPAEEVPFTFLVQTDTQMHETGLGSFEKFIEVAKKENFDFMIHVGDLVQNDRKYAMWERFLEEETALAGEKPLMAILGNHEYVEYGRPEARNYKMYLSLPGTEFWYSFNYSNAVFVALGVYDYENFKWDEKELEMLNKALNGTSKWKIVYFHIPCVDFYLDEASLNLTKYVAPIVSRYKPDLVIMGHVHGYARAKINGTMWVTLSSAGGLPVPVVSDDKKVDYYYFNYGYAIVHIDGKTLKFYFKDLSGRILDSFTLKKV